MLYDTRWSAAAETALPSFGPRWHSRSHLDIRPVLWSLRNRPAEWEQTEFTLTHVPSKHEFWTANGFWFYSLYRADCSCKKVHGGEFSFIQKAQFHLARRTVAALTRRRLSEEIAEIKVHFREHFASSSVPSQGREEA